MHFLFCWWKGIDDPGKYHTYTQDFGVSTQFPVFFGSTMSQKLLEIAPEFEPDKTEGIYSREIGLTNDKERRSSSNRKHDSAE